MRCARIAVARARGWRWRCPYATARIRDNPAFKEEDTGVSCRCSVGEKTYKSPNMALPQPEWRAIIFRSVATNPSIATDFMRNTAPLTKITGPFLFFSAKRRGDCAPFSTPTPQIFARCTIGRPRLVRSTSRSVFAASPPSSRFITSASKGVSAALGFSR